MLRACPLVYGNLTGAGVVSSQPRTMPRSNREGGGRCGGQDLPSERAYGGISTEWVRLPKAQTPLNQTRSDLFSPKRREVQGFDHIGHRAASGGLNEPSYHQMGQLSNPIGRRHLFLFLIAVDQLAPPSVRGLEFVKQQRPFLRAPSHQPGSAKRLPVGKFPVETFPEQSLHRDLGVDDSVLVEPALLDELKACKRNGERPLRISHELVPYPPRKSHERDHVVFGQHVGLADRTHPRGSGGKEGVKARNRAWNPEIRGPDCDVRESHHLGSVRAEAGGRQLEVLENREHVSGLPQHGDWPDRREDPDRTERWHESLIHLGNPGE